MDNSNEDKPQPSQIEASQFLRIPIRRIGVVIGKGGSNRRKIEEKTLSIIIIDSDTGEVEIRPRPELKDPVLLLKARDIIKAIGRGFSLDQSIKLADDDFYLEVIRLKSPLGNNPNKIKRIKSRIIGTEGKTRASIEELTSCSIVILGSTVSIIGKYERIGSAKDAIQRLIEGATIESVLGELEDLKRELNKDEAKLWKTEEDEKSMKDIFPDEEEEDIFTDLDTDEETTETEE